MWLGGWEERCTAVVSGDGPGVCLIVVDLRRELVVSVQANLHGNGTAGKI